MSGPLQYLFNNLSGWQRAQQVAAESLRTAGWAVEEGVKVVVRGLPGELDVIGYADFIATKNGEMLVGEVKSGMHAKLTSFQKFLLTSDGALGRLEIASAGRALALGVDAGRPLASQLSAGAKIMYTLTGELGGRAGSQWAARNGGALATKVFFNGLKVIGSVPVMLLTQPGN